jgi:LacI family transcriptional regulator
MTLKLEGNLVLEQRPRLKQACLKLEQMARNLGPQAKLPTMLELRSQLGVSLRTLNDAVRELERGGILRSINGVGVYVANQPQVRKMEKLGLLFRAGSLNYPYTRDLLTGIRREAARHDLEIILLDEETETVEPERVDALLMYCHETEALLMDLPPGLPHVLLFRHSPDFTCVALDDFEAGRTAARHLLELGHRRIVCLPSSNSDSISLLRLAGYEAAHQEAGVAVDKKLIKFLHKSPLTDYHIEGELIMKSLLEGSWEEMDCTAILAHNDETAIGIMKTLADAGIRVPGDVSVMGFDGTEVSDLCTPRLTTVKLPLVEMGERAVKVLLEQMRDGIARTEKIVLPVRLKLSESTAPVSKDK